MSSVDNNDGRYAPPRAAVDDVPEATDGLVLATRGQRFGAAIVDVVVIIVAMGALALLTPWNLLADDGRSLWALSLLSPVLSFGLFLLTNGYLLLRHGQTVGKRALGLRIVQRNGLVVPPARLIGLRYGVFYALNVVPLVGIVVSLIDPLLIFRASRRCLHDDLADTLVIKA